MENDISRDNGLSDESIGVFINGASFSWRDFTWGDFSAARFFLA